MTPLRAKTAPQRHFTVPNLAWLTRFMAAFTATATALVPMATWGFSTPTT